MNRTLPRIAVCALLAAALAAPSSAQAQLQKRLIPTAAGGIIGMGAGGYVALGVVTLKARYGHYLYVIGDAAFGWESGAVLAGGATGAALGFWDIERLRNGVYGSIAGGLVGTGIGALIGYKKWPAPEGKWAGGVIGGSAGILVGVVAGSLLLPTSKDDDGEAPSAPARIGITIPVSW
jgi:hypothetical protein